MGKFSSALVSVVVNCCSAGEGQCAETIEPQTRNRGLSPVALLTLAIEEELGHSGVTQSSPVMTLPDSAHSRNVEITEGC